MLKIARHRGWTEVRLSGDETFRREAWIQAKAMGLEIRGYKPRDRDRQAAGDPHPTSKADRDPGARHPGGDRLRAAAVVIKRLIDDPAARTRLMERAIERLRSHEVADRSTRDKSRTPDRRDGRA